jgi:hypothetical protein
LKFPEDVRAQLARVFENRHRDWLGAETAIEPGEAERWPLEIDLGIPAERLALRQLDAVRAWVAEWQLWHGAGALLWCQRRWPRLGTHRLPEKLLFKDPVEVVSFLGESVRWERVRTRFNELVHCWPNLCRELPRHFRTLIP